MKYPELVSVVVANKVPSASKSFNTTLSVAYKFSMSAEINVFSESSKLTKPPVNVPEIAVVDSSAKTLKLIVLNTIAKQSIIANILLNFTYTPSFLNEFSGNPVSGFSENIMTFFRLALNLSEKCYSFCSPPCAIHQLCTLIMCQRLFSITSIESIERESNMLFYN